MKDYKYNTSSKVFTEKWNLVRRMKNTHDKQQKRMGEICEKDFSRLSDLRRHKKALIIEQTKFNAQNATKIKQSR